MLDKVAGIQGICTILQYAILKEDYDDAKTQTFVEMKNAAQSCDVLTLI
ncbi:hypothetical protein [Ruminococcus sp.]|nr:hypothetical protein [Ruminococcus sp.]MEE1262378.1 hypothetical protein [Ruminococcus sp.]